MVRGDQYVGITRLGYRAMAEMIKDGIYRLKGPEQLVVAQNLAASVRNSKWHSDK